MDFAHIPVLLEETIQYLDIKPDGIYVDGTLGGGGHSYEIVKRLTKGGRLIGIDQDEEAIKAARERLSDFDGQVYIIRNNYCQMKKVLKELGVKQVNGILLDLGVSSYQLDAVQRGFSYKEDAPLDMRMDTRQKKTAEDIVNEYTEEELSKIIREYGEERFAKRVAKNIVMDRKQKPIKTTGELADIIKKSIPIKARIEGGHPAKRTFQAIRIECNKELQVLRELLEDLPDLLAEGGRACIITFHSLEDRIVKLAFREVENPCTCPPSFPICVCGKKPKGRVITKKPVLPTEKECEKNPRAKSAKLRVLERVEF